MNLKQKLTVIGSVVGVGLASVSMSANAALPAALTTALTDLKADASSLLNDYGVPIFATVTIGILAIVIVKKILFRIF